MRSPLTSILFRRVCGSGVTVTRATPRLPTPSQFTRVLVGALNESQLRTLLAHEVGHAMRRATMLKRVGSYFWPPALALVVGAMAAAAVGSFAAKPLAITDPQTLCALVLRVGRDSCKNSQN